MSLCVEFCHDSPAGTQHLGDTVADHWTLFMFASCILPNHEMLHNIPEFCVHHGDGHGDGDGQTLARTYAVTSYIHTILHVIHHTLSDTSIFIIRHTSHRHLDFHVCVVTVTVVRHHYPLHNHSQYTKYYINFFIITRVQ